jgi:hypothetical protein
MDVGTQKDMSTLAGNVRSRRRDTAEAAVRADAGCSRCGTAEQFRRKAA